MKVLYSAAPVTGERQTCSARKQQRTGASACRTGRRSGPTDEAGFRNRNSGKIQGTSESGRCVKEGESHRAEERYGYPYAGILLERGGGFTSETSGICPAGSAYVSDKSSWNQRDQPPDWKRGDCPAGRNYGDSLSTSMVPSCASIITFAIQHNCTSYRLAYRINPSSPITAALNYARQNRKQPVGLESTITLIHTLHQKIRGSGGLKSPTKIPSKLLSGCPIFNH